jgi:hypothetical protein
MPVSSYSSQHKPRSSLPPPQINDEKQKRYSSIGIEYYRAVASISLNHRKKKWSSCILKPICLTGHVAYCPEVIILDYSSNQESIVH